MVWLGGAVRASRRLPTAVVRRRGRGLSRGTGKPGIPRIPGLPGDDRLPPGTGVSERTWVRAAPAGPRGVSGRTRLRAGPGLRARPGLRAGPGGYPADGVAAGGRARAAGVPHRPGALARRWILRAGW